MIRNKNVHTGFSWLWLGLFSVSLGIILSIFATNLAVAEDINVVFSVNEPSPTSTPKTIIKLPIDSSVDSAPVLEGQLAGLEPYSPVTVYANSQPVLIASGFADKYGVFKFKVRLPSNLEPGTHSITANLQLLGQVSPSLVTVAKFEVSSSGVIGKQNSDGAQNPSPGESTGGGEGPGGGGETQSPQPTSSPNPADGFNSIGGVLLVGGYSATSWPTWNPAGEKARITLSLYNSYKKSFPVGVKSRVQNVFGFDVSQGKPLKVPGLRPGHYLDVTTETVSGIGQWGFYTATVSVSPPSDVDGIALTSLTRQVNFVVIPIWPTVTILFILLMLFLRNLSGNFRGVLKSRSRFVNTVDEDEGVK